ncbi:MAG: HAD-IA family hydrolase [Rhodospirillaceae bacterium]|nr:HAD-IA family hydrolase [Rhodospirillaceae bacterium]MBT5240260.1 HAD-IA family hydrolase [Rhodospirillaceae bacterium]MBT5565435.1 HAD-IA family hydrolase [Rhodospirillaceae bacterium]MBT6089249.1 HAD-IA family hydrolase [Rhodospirillaceae bacterium]MBT7451107.1 HAD-IA family hydrolase [Rhodospirillaceae bacterium]
MSELSLVILDLDGTLVDSRQLIIHIMNVAADEAGIPHPTDEATGRIIGLSLERAIEELFPDESSRSRAGVLDAYRVEALRMRADPADPESLFIGAHEAVRALRDAGYLLGIATGKARRGVEHFCTRYNMGGWFDTVQTPDTNPSKPHPGMIESAMAETGIPASRTVMVGDTVFDLEMARNAGVFGVGVSWGNHPVCELERAGSHHIVEAIEDLPQVIANVFQQGAQA